MSTPKIIAREPGFYPKGFRPSWWRCPKCGEWWHDSWQEHPHAADWDDKPHCICDGWGPFMEKQDGGPES